MKYVSVMGLNIRNSLVDKPLEGGVNYISVEFLMWDPVAE
jgi:hypothetical protein